MERGAILAAVRDIIRSELDEPTVAVTESTVIDDIDGWDSVAHVRIIVAIEARFAVRFEPDEYMDFQSVADVIDALSKKLAEAGDGQPRVAALRA